MERISGRHRLKLALRRPFRISWSSRPGLLGFREEIQGLLFTCGASMMSEHLWVGIGLLGEAQFGARFLVQWIASERQKKSVVPHAFWYLSIGGGITLLTYAIYRLDPVFIVGEAFGLLVFLRNLCFIRRTPVSHVPR